jgi:hypothetical protein
VTGMAGLAPRRMAWMGGVALRRRARMAGRLVGGVRGRGAVALGVGLAQATGAGAGRGRPGRGLRRRRIRGGMRRGRAEGVVRGWHHRAEPAPQVPRQTRSCRGGDQRHADRAAAPRDQCPARRRPGHPGEPAGQSGQAERDAIVGTLLAEERRHRELLERFRQRCGPASSSRISTWKRRSACSSVPSTRATWVPGRSPTTGRNAFSASSGRQAAHPRMI